jgi:hypothetical protein
VFVVCKILLTYGCHVPHVHEKRSISIKAEHLKRVRLLS